MNQESIASYVDWSQHKRGRKSDPLAAELGLLCAALRWSPLYKGHDFSWLRAFISQIEPDDEEEKRDRKALKYLPYEVLEKIPAMIRARREEVSRSGARQLALLVHDELLFSWLVTLVWRQRNIRECRIGHNLFKAAISPFTKIAVPTWARERMKANPNEQFWQFYFRKNETKTKHEVRAVLPRKLVPLLEDYLQNYRAVLVTRADPGTLFLNRDGRVLTVSVVLLLVSNLTLRYAQKRVTPHIFRDIFAYYWLDHHPEDYLTVSKALWHRSVATTLRIYGCRFDESHGLRRIEEWFESRADASERIAPATPEQPPRLLGNDTPGVGENGGGTIQPKTRLEFDFRRKGTKRGAA